MRIILAVAILFLALTYGLYGQPAIPDPGPVFEDSVVPRIDITVHPDTLLWMYNNPYSDIEFRAKFIFNSGSLNETVEEVGFRLRGNTSRISYKKSFKVSFNTYTPGGKFHGLEKLNLNGEHNDPSVMRSKVMLDLLRKWGIPAPRANHVRLYINGNYYGLYLNVEHIDEQFTESRYGNNNGNLYKCLWPADLNYLGPEPDLYKLVSGSRRVYDLTIFEGTDNYSDLASLIDVINNGSGGGQACRLGDQFNIYDYLRVMVADIFCGNWDGYIFNKNNFYLYHNSSTGKFEYIPYDLDNTFGIDWFNIDWSQRNIYNWAPGGGEKRPLYTRIMNDPELRAQFTYYCNQMVGNLNIDSLVSKIEKRKVLIAPFVAIDPFYPGDYGFTLIDFNNSFQSARGGHVKHGLYPFLQERKTSMLSQMEPGTSLPVIKYIGHSIEPDQRIIIRAFVEAKEMPLSVRLIYSVDGAILDRQMVASAPAGFYETTLHPVFPQNKISYRIEASDVTGRYITLPCNPVTISNSSYAATVGNSLFVYPNPAGGRYLFVNKTINYRIINSQGKVVSEGNEVSRVEIGSLAPGYYFIVSDNGEAATFIKM